MIFFHIKKNKHINTKFSCEGESIEGLNAFLKHLSIIETLIDKFKEKNIR